MNPAFGDTYSSAYDQLYREKDYAGECDLVERLLARYAQGPVKSILDLGCGTGNHLVPLAQRGYAMTGADLSADMLAAARAKAAAAKLDVGLHQGDVRSLRLGRTFDAALMMFAVLGYQTSNQDVVQTLETVRTHLRPGGIFIFDVWHGPAVLHERPSQRVKSIPTPDGRIIRISDGTLDTAKHQCKVQFDVIRIQNDRVVAQTQETHPMRYFFPLELQLFLETNGFELIHIGQFPNHDDKPDDKNWNVIAVAKAI